MSPSVGDVAHFIIDALVNVGALACILVWGRWCFRRWREPASRTEPLVPMNERERPFWSFFDALVMFGANVAVLAALQFWWMPTNIETTTAADELTRTASDSYRRVTAAMLLSAIASGAITFLWLRLLNPHPLRGLRLIVDRRNLMLGLKASVMVLPPVLIISGIVNQFQQYDHEVLERLREVDSMALFLLMFLSTAIVTPIFEEVLFRGLIQGGLQGAIDGPVAEPESWRPISYLPILISSAIFAMMHLGQGAAPIPLFFLALGLGYLYRQTGNLTAPIVVHMVLNALTMIASFTESGDL